MSPLDLVRSRDGSMSLTKLSAATAHALAAILFVRLQWSSPFNETLWMLYMGVAIGHAITDKTAAQVKDFKDKKLDVTAEAMKAPE